MRERSMARLAIVMTHYRMPEHRLIDWIVWNSSAIESVGSDVWCVSDVPRAGLPPWLRMLIYPLPMDIFSLSCTSNFGIRSAIDSGAEIVAKTDPDCILSPELVADMAALTPGHGLCPVYRMAAAATPEAMAASKPWLASKGTLALLSSHWEAIQGYDERQSGYGIEDGDAFCRAAAMPSQVLSRGERPIYHVAHSVASQSAGNSRGDCWGRASGFNPRNHRPNMACRRTRWSCADWGRAIAT